MKYWAIIADNLLAALPANENNRSDRECSRACHCDL